MNSRYLINTKTPFSAVHKSYYPCLVAHSHLHYPGRRVQVALDSVFLSKNISGESLAKTFDYHSHSHPLLNSP